MERLIKLPKRLQVIVAHIEKGAAVADIGTDHGLLPVYLAQSETARSIVASDISAGSLDSARKNAAKYGVEDKIRFVTAPGLDGVGEHEADTVVISGIGGENIAGIIKDAPWLKQRGVKLILQPQTKNGKLTGFLRENGYAIHGTQLVQDRDRFYTVILAGGEKKGESQVASVNDVYNYLNSIAPVEMKMDFDNVGLLVGRAGADASKILVSLDVTHDVITEALDTGVGLIVSHHPMFFSLTSVADTDTTGAKIVRLVEGGVSVICMHTNLDAARGGVNDALAQAAGIAGDGRGEAELLSPAGTLATGEAYSYGRVGVLQEPCDLREYLAMLKKSLATNGLRYHDAGKKVCKVAVVGGSGGGELAHAYAQGCDTFVTADVKYDVFLEAKELGINLIDGDHFCTENLVTGVLVEKLREKFPKSEVSVSQRHRQTASFYG